MCGTASASSSTDVVVAAESISNVRAECAACSSMTKDELNQAVAEEFSGDAAEEEASSRHRVMLHVYDIDPITAKLNETFLRSINLGAFHCGVEVCGEEWFYAWGETDECGVHCNQPQCHRVHIYRESVCMGHSPLSFDEIHRVISDAHDKWRANDYHPITKNCVSFAEELIEALGAVNEPFPEWVRGAADAGKLPILYPIADWGWQWVKWYCSEEPPPET